MPEEGFVSERICSAAKLTAAGYTEVRTVLLGKHRAVIHYKPEREDGAFKHAGRLQAVLHPRGEVADVWFCDAADRCRKLGESRRDPEPTPAPPPAPQAAPDGPVAPPPTPPAEEPPK